MHLTKSTASRTLDANFDFVPSTCDVVASFGAFGIFRLPPMMSLTPLVKSSDDCEQRLKLRKQKEER